MKKAINSKEHFRLKIKSCATKVLYFWKIYIPDRDDSKLDSICS